MIVARRSNSPIDSLAMTAVWLINCGLTVVTVTAWARVTVDVGPGAPDRRGEFIRR